MLNYPFEIQKLNNQEQIVENVEQHIDKNGSAKTWHYKLFRNIDQVDRFYKGLSEEKEVESWLCIHSENPAYIRKANKTLEKEMEPEGTTPEHPEYIGIYSSSE